MQTDKNSMFLVAPGIVTSGGTHGSLCGAMTGASCGALKVPYHSLTMYIVQMLMSPLLFIFPSIGLELGCPNCWVKHNACIISWMEHSGDKNSLHPETAELRSIAADVTGGTRSGTVHARSLSLPGTILTLKWCAAHTYYPTS